MNYKLFLKIMLIYTLFNCILYPMIDYSSLTVEIMRVILFAIIGFLVGRHVFVKYKDAMNPKVILSNKYFGLKIAALLFLLLIYYTYNMETDVLKLYDNIYSMFREVSLEDMNKYPLIVNFMFDSYFESFALVSYLVSYSVYQFTIYILKKRKNENATSPYYAPKLSQNEEARTYWGK